MNNGIARRFADLTAVGPLVFDLATASVVHRGEPGAVELKHLATGTTKDPY